MTTMNFLQLRKQSHKGGRVNPLLLSTIVKRSFSYLSCPDLVACRVVNKLWNEEATKLLQGSVISTLQDWHSIEQYNRVVTAHLKSTAANLFTDARLDQNVNLADLNTQNALGKFAAIIKYLEVDTNVGAPEWRILLFDQFINLKELHIHGAVPFQPLIAVPELSGDNSKQSPVPSTSSGAGSISRSGSRKQKQLLQLIIMSFRLTNRKTEDIFVRRFFRDLFSLTPNLRSLTYTKDDPFGNDFQKTMFACLMHSIVPREGKGQLETFKCPSLQCGTKELKDISIRSFPLKELHIQIGTDVSAPYLESFLQGLDETLEKVRFGFSPGAPLNIIVTTPATRFVNLKEITLCEYRRSIGFVGNLPNLRKLTLRRVNIKRALLSIGWSFENKTQTELSKTLRELYVFNEYIPRDQGNCTRELVLKLAYCFPNLKVIRLEGLDDSSLRHLFKSFQNLEELYAPRGAYTDEAFRSFTEKANLCSSKSHGRLLHAAFDASHLTSLRTLELESIALSDKFITQGIIYWQSLRSLTLKYCTISFPVLSRLLMELDLHHLCLQFATILTDKVLKVADDPVEMLHEEDVLDLSYSMIQKWRFCSFKMLFVRVP